MALVNPWVGDRPWTHGPVMVNGGYGGLPRWYPSGRCTSAARTCRVHAMYRASTRRRTARTGRFGGHSGQSRSRFPGPTDRTSVQSDNNNTISQFGPSNDGQGEPIDN